MQFRSFGRTGWQVSEVGYGMSEDELFPLCRELKVGVVARVPFGEGTLTGALAADSRWPAGDWRNHYFDEDNLGPIVAIAESLKKLVPQEITTLEPSFRECVSRTTYDSCSGAHANCAFQAQGLARIGAE